MPGRRLFIFFFLLYVFCQAPFSWADRKEGGGLCTEANTTVEMQVCLVQKLEESEILMADRLNRLMKCLDSGQQEQLAGDQNVWLRFRELNADFEASGERGGSLYTVERLAILVEMTQKRADELERFYLKFCNSDFK